MRDFDKQFKRHHSLMATFGVFWVLSFCAGLAGVIALVYVAWHFIAKFW